MARLMCCVIAAGFLVFACNVRADFANSRLCPQWANLVEKLEVIDVETRDAVKLRWMMLDDHLRFRLLMRAIQWIDAGETSESAYKLCVSI